MRVDTQPWAMMLSTAAIALAWRQLRFAALHFATLSMFLCASLMLLLDTSDLSATRTVAGYYSFFALSVIIAHAARFEQRAMLKSIDIALIVWTVVGAIQRFVARSAFDWLISDARTTATRGVIGLAPEPTFYATSILLILLWRSLFGLRPWHVMIGLFVVLALASSSQVALIFAAAVAAFVLTSLVRPKFFGWALSVTIVGAGVVLLFALALPASRLGALLNLIGQHPKLVLLDQSINDRAVQIFACLSSIYRNSFLPAGLDTDVWLTFVNRVRLDFPDIFWSPQFADRIMSGLGAVIYQLGFLASIFIGILVLSISRLNIDWQFKIIWGWIFILVIFTAIPLGQPMLGAVLGALAYKSVPNPRNIPKA